MTSWEEFLANFVLANRNEELFHVKHPQMWIEFHMFVKKILTNIFQSYKAFTIFQQFGLQKLSTIRPLFTNFV